MFEKPMVENERNLFAPSQSKKDNQSIIKKESQNGPGICSLI